MVFTFVLNKRNNQILDKKMLPNTKVIHILHPQAGKSLTSTGVGPLLSMVSWWWSFY